MVNCELTLKQSSPGQLDAKTEAIRNLHSKVNQLLYGASGLLQEEAKSLWKENPKLPSFSTIFRKYIGLTQRVAETVSITAGHPFDTVVYPGSGTDLLTGIAHCQNRVNRLLTYDKEDLYTQRPVNSNDEEKQLLKDILTQRTDLGFHEGTSNIQLLGIVSDLALMGVNPASIQVKSETIIPGEGKQRCITITTTQFVLPNGRQITHTHFGGLIFRNFSNDRTNIVDSPTDQPRNLFIIERTLQEIAVGNHIIMIRKAGGHLGGLTEQFYPLLPDGSIISTDTASKGSRTEMELFIDLGLNDINLKDIVTPETKEQLKQLEGLASYTCDSLRPRFEYGYLDSLTALSIFRLNRLKRLENSPNPGSFYYTHQQVQAINCI